MPRTIQDRLSMALAARGCRELSSPSRKFRAFEVALGGTVYFVGKGGALRKSSRLAVTDSISMERHPFRAKLLSEVGQKGDSTYRPGQG